MTKRKIMEKWETQQAEKQAKPIEKEIKYKIITGRSPNQKEYLKSISTKRVTFGIGCAGTGKTLLAVALGVKGVLTGEYEKILVCRPAREAIGENLGFLPGSLKEKVDPYLQPIWDSIDEIIENPEDAKKFKNDRVEIVAFAFLRGRTFKRKFLIADELQNATHKQMEMLLTRIGDGAKFVLNGDPAQSDLPDPHQGALIYNAEIVKESSNFGVVYLNKSDIQRDKLVEEYISLRESYEKPRTLKEMLRGYRERNGGTCPDYCDDEEIIGGW